MSVDPRSLPLLPVSGVAPLNRDAGEWFALDEDPQFDIPLPQGWGGRWVRFSVDVEPFAPWNSFPVLYIDCGKGYSEAEAVKLPQPALGQKVIESIFPLPPNAFRARLDPLAQAGPFRIGAPSINRLRKPHAGFAIARAVAQTRGWDEILKRLGMSLLPAPTSKRVRSFVNWLIDNYREPQKAPRTYSSWISLYETKAVSYEYLARNHHLWSSRPLISVVLPLRGKSATDPSDAINSVRGQLYPYWQLLIACHSSSPQLENLQTLARTDHRVKICEGDTASSVVDLVNAALGSASGELVLLLDPSDRLHSLALHYSAEEAVFNPEAAIIFSDEDRIDEQDARRDPHFKCEFNYELLLSHNAIGRLCAFRRSLIDEVGGLRTGFDGAEEYDLLMRAIERLESQRIVRLPRVLYHRRVTSPHEDRRRLVAPKAEAARTVIQEHLRRLGVAARVTACPEAPAMNRVRFATSEATPLVSIIIPTRDRADLLKTCISSVLGKTTYPNFEILIVDNNSSERATFDLFERLQGEERIRLLRDQSPFNYSRINNFAVAESRGSFLCLMNNDIEVITPDWIEELLSFAARPHVGAVGCRLWYPDGRLQHGGVLLGIGGVAGHAHRFLDRTQPGYFGRALGHQSFSAITAAALMIRKTTFEQVGGLDEAFEVAFNDVDFCLRLREKGFRNVWTPYAEMIHHESASRGSETTPEKRVRFQGEVERMKFRWGNLLKNDPAYSPNLTLDSEDFSLAWPPRLSWRSRHWNSVTDASHSGQSLVATQDRLI